MRKIYCDVCRREIPRIPDVICIGAGVEVVGESVDADDTLDICSVCKDMIREYIKHLQDKYSATRRIDEIKPRPPKNTDSPFTA